MAPPPHVVRWSSSKTLNGPTSGPNMRRSPCRTASGPAGRCRLSTMPGLCSARWLSITASDERRRRGRLISFSSRPPWRHLSCSDIATARDFAPPMRGSKRLFGVRTSAFGQAASTATTAGSTNGASVSTSTRVTDLIRTDVGARGFILRMSSATPERATTPRGVSSSTMSLTIGS